jgi:hypothetical protein
MDDTAMDAMKNAVTRSIEDAFDMLHEINECPDNDAILAFVESEEMLFPKVEYDIVEMAASVLVEDAKRGASIKGSYFWFFEKGSAQYRLPTFSEWVREAPAGLRRQDHILLSAVDKKIRKFIKGFHEWLESKTESTIMKEKDGRLHSYLLGLPAATAVVAIAHQTGYFGYNGLVENHTKIEYPPLIDNIATLAYLHVFNHHVPQHPSTLLSGQGWNDSVESFFNQVKGMANRKVAETVAKQKKPPARQPAKTNKKKAAPKKAPHLRSKVLAPGRAKKNAKKKATIPEPIPEPEGSDDSDEVDGGDEDAVEQVDSERARVLCFKCNFLLDGGPFTMGSCRVMDGPGQDKVWAYMDEERKPRPGRNRYLFENMQKKLREHYVTQHNGEEFPDILRFTELKNKAGVIEAYNARHDPYAIKRATVDAWLQKNTRNNCASALANILSYAYTEAQHMEKYRGLFNVYLTDVKPAWPQARADDYLHAK